jgi:2-methylcitrate dehydratase PrpD
MKRTGLRFEDVETITVPTYQAALNVLTLSEAAATVHQSKFSMGFVLAVAAMHRRASIIDFTEEALTDQSLRKFQRRVTMVLDPAIEALFPTKWTGRVEVLTKNGEKLVEAVDSVKGDPDQALTRYTIPHASSTDLHADSS